MKKNINREETMRTEKKIIDNKVHAVYNIVVHRFRMSDVEDPELYAAEPLYKWQQSEIGQWVMSKAIETPEFHSQLDHNVMGYKFAVTAKLLEKDYTVWCLKYQPLVDKL